MSTARSRSSRPGLSGAAAMRAQAAHRAHLIRVLGMKPEPPVGTYATRYAATTGEMVKWLRIDGHRDIPEWTDFLSSAEREAYRRHGYR